MDETTIVTTEEVVIAPETETVEETPVTPTE